MWDALEFLLNGFVFVLIGLQLPYVLAGIKGMSTAGLVGYGLAFSAVLVLLRMAWMFPARAPHGGFGHASGTSNMRCRRPTRFSLWDGRECAGWLHWPQPALCL